MVPTESGGGSVSAQGVVDLAVVAYQFGLHAAPGPLLGSNIAAAALGRWGSAEQQNGPLQELLGGRATGAWALAEAPPHDALGEDRARATESVDGFVLEGVKSPVEGGVDAVIFRGHRPVRLGTAPVPGAERHARVARHTAARSRHDQAIRPPRL